jgi:uncharacterized protein
MLTRILIVLALCCPVIYAADPPPPGPPPTQSAPARQADAAGNPPSEASVKQLLEVMQAHKMLDATQAQMSAFMKQMMEQATQGQKITPQIQKDIDRRQSEMMSAFKEILDWNKLEPMYVRVYQKSFTQPELDGMIGFYKTTAGQAVINKMPVVMQNTMSEMQQMMQPMIQRMRQQQQEVVAEIKAENEKKGG